MGAMKPMIKKVIRIPSLLLAMLALAPLTGLAAGGGIALQSPGNDVADVASLQRGARNFVNYCMGCHSAQYIRYNKLQESLQLSEEQVQENLMFAARKVDEMMMSAMPPADAARWFGQTPPDLTLTARSRGTDWIYTFLKSFYIDEGAAMGTNNLVLPNASMPHVLWELQGLQTASFNDSVDQNTGETIEHFGDPAYFNEFTRVSDGTLSPEEYDLFVRDIVNFLDWAATPEQLQRRRLGYWVMAFLFVFLIFAYLLKTEIWKDVK